MGSLISWPHIFLEETYTPALYWKLTGFNTQSTQADICFILIGTGLFLNVQTKQAWCARRMQGWVGVCMLYWKVGRFTLQQKVLPLPNTWPESRTMTWFFSPPNVGSRHLADRKKLDTLITQPRPDDSRPLVFMDLNRVLIFLLYFSPLHVIRQIRVNCRPSSSLLPL